MPWGEASWNWKSAEKNCWQGNQSPEWLFKKLQGPYKCALREHRKQEKEDVERVRAKLPVEMQTAMSYSGEKGASQWLGVLPLTEYGFSFHKGAFQDALALHYRWTPRHVPSQCACGKRFTVEHAFSCPYGGFPFL